MTDFEFDNEKKTGTNLASQPTVCVTCGGDRYVTVRLRTPDQSIWMSDNGINVPKGRFHEEVAPCPDCNPVEVTYWRHDRSLFRTMDPAAARAALNG